MKTCMVLYYLDDCERGTHCFSVVPESLAAKKALPWHGESTALSPLPLIFSYKSEKSLCGAVPEGGSAATIAEPFIERMWRNRPGSALSDGVMDGVGRNDGYDVLGKAGTAIVTNASNIHAGTVRQSLSARRSIILWWSHGPQNRPEFEPWLSDPPPTKEIRGPHRALPPRLTESEQWGWLFDERPLSEAEKWRVLGVAATAGPRL